MHIGLGMYMYVVTEAGNCALLSVSIRDSMGIYITQIIKEFVLTLADRL